MDMQSLKKHEPVVIFQSDLEKQLVALLEPMVFAQDCELVRLKVSSSNGKQKLGLFIDEQKTQSVIKLEKLTFLNRFLGDALDVADAEHKLFKSRYELEVSSPGVDRPLTKKSHFESAVNGRVRVKTDGTENPKTISAVLSNVDNVGLVLVTSKTEEKIELPWAQIRDARLVYEFPSNKIVKNKKKDSLKRRG